MSTFIIKFRSALGNEYNKVFCNITKNYNLSLVIIMTTNDKDNSNNLILFNEYIINGISKIDFISESYECVFNNNLIIFDSASASAFNEFNEIVSNALKTLYDKETYPSGNVRCVGNMLLIDQETKSKVLNGNGTIFYDNPHQQILYNGEFENNYMDGCGTFYSKDGCIKLVANNISKNIPKFVGELQFNYADYKISYIVDFDDTWIKLLPDASDDNIRKLVISEQFIDKIAKIYVDPFILDKYKYKQMTTNDKLNLLYDKIQSIDKVLLNHRMNIKQINDDNYKNWIIFGIFTIVCNLYIISQI